LKPDPSIAGNRYASADWETRMAKVPVNVAQPLDQILGPRTLIVGLEAGNATKAYPVELLVKQSPIIDELGGVPLVVVLGTDGKSVRAYERVVDGRKLELFTKKDSPTLVLVDTQTGSEWDFTGNAVKGELNGKQLKQILVLYDYWFDWKNYHPTTDVYVAR
jgi:Protein of unknown function (DUF3179)